MCVRILLCPLPPSRVLDAWADDLDAAERAYLATLRHAAARARFIAGHALLRNALAQAIGVPRHTLAFTRASTGQWHAKAPPDCEIPAFSISHGASAIGVAFSRSSPVGLDIERLDAASVALALDGVYSPQELAALRACTDDSQRGHLALVLWTAKEALLKLHGRGLDGQPLDAAGTCLRTLDAPLLDGTYCVTVAYRAPPGAPHVHIHVDLIGSAGPATPPSPCPAAASPPS